MAISEVNVTKYNKFIGFSANNLHYLNRVYKKCPVSPHDTPLIFIFVGIQSGWVINLNDNKLG